MKQSYLQLLATGVVVARKIWVNENSKKDQVTVQVVQRIKLPAEATVLSNKVAALSQGINAENVGYNNVTALISMKREVAQKLFGTVNEDFSKTGKGINVSEVFGLKTEVQVVENTEKNPKSAKQTPKINPSTKDTLMYKGMPIYRHTSLVEEGSAKNVFLRHDGITAGSSTTTTRQFTNAEEEVIGTEA